MSPTLRSAARLMMMAAATAIPTISAELTMPRSLGAQETDTFRPGFGWTPGLHIAATESRVGILREGAASDSGLVSRATYTIQVSEHDDGLLISHQDLRVERVGDFPEDLEPIAKVNTVVADNLKYWMRLPDLVVTREGEFLRVDELEAFQYRVDSSIRPVARALAGDDPEIMELLDELLAVVVNEDMITSLASDRWSSLVDSWADTDWLVGTVYAADIEAPNPLVPGPPIPYTINAGVTDRRECDAPSGGAECAVFVMVTRPADSAIGEASRILADSLGVQLLASADPAAAAEYRQGEREILTFEELELQTRVELMTDPISLLPLWLEERQVRRGSGTGLGEPFTFHTEEILTTDFSYPDRR